MKKILLIALVFATLFSCKEDENPNYGYAAFENYKSIGKVVVDTEAGSETITLFTDKKVGTVVPVGTDWCSGTIQDGKLTIEYQANNTGATREGELEITMDMFKLTLKVYQRTTGTDYIEILNPGSDDRMGWTAVASDTQSSEGGGLGVDAIFINNHTTFWHSQYSPNVPLPHWIVIDLKEEMDINQVRMGWRMNGANVYIHVRKVIVETSNDGENFTPTGGEIFREPVDGKMSSPDYTPYTNCPFPTVKARYIRLMMTESNAPDVCHVAYVKVYEP